jgi:hypothetical protein
LSAQAEKLKSIKIPQNFNLSHCDESLIEVGIHRADHRGWPSLFVDLVLAIVIR